MAIKRRNQWISTSVNEKRRRCNGRISCEICDSLFFSQTELRSHQYDKHKGNQWRCKMCGNEMKFSRSDFGRYIHPCEPKPSWKNQQSPPKFQSELREDG